MRSALRIGLDRNLDLVDDRSDLGPSLPIGLAGFPGDEVGELRFLLAHDVAEAAQRLDPIGDRMGCPSRLCGARRCNLGGSIADLAGPDFLAGGRIGGSQGPRHTNALGDLRLFVKLSVHPAPLPRPFAGLL